MTDTHDRHGYPLQGFFVAHRRFTGYSFTPEGSWGDTLDGPLYFAFHGFWGRAVLVFALNFVLIGFIIAPFLAYPAWRERAREKAERAIAAGVVV